MPDERSPPGPTDIGEPVLDTDDNQIATIEAIEGEVVYVRPEPSGDEARGRSSLGWDDLDARYPLEANVVERIEDAPGATFRIDLGALQGGEAADEHLARGGPEPDEPAQREE